MLDLSVFWMLARFMVWGLAKPGLGCSRELTACYFCHGGDATQDSEGLGLRPFFEHHFS